MFFQRFFISYVFLLCLLGSSNSLLAETFYVSPNGDDSMPGSEAQPFASPKGCFDNMAGGDTCLFTTGTWSGRSSKRFLPKWNTCEGPSGSAENPTRYAAAPGAKPVFESFGASGAEVRDDCNFIEIDGVHTTQSFIIWSVSDIRVTGSEMEGGKDCDGNWSAVRMEGISDIRFDHNYLHRLKKRDGCRVSALITAFVIDDIVIEFNTFDITDGASPAFGVMFLKDSPTRVKVRYNHVIGKHITGSNQNLAPRIGRELEVYGNVIERGSIRTLFAIIDTNIHHNTIIGGTILGDGSGNDGLIVRDNLVSTPDLNIRLLKGNWPPTTYDIDYNVYTSSAKYQGNWFADPPDRIEENDIVKWARKIQAAGCVGCEAHSKELDCTFEEGEDTSFHIKEGPCLSASSDGKEIGAYGLTDCVGHLCDGTPVVVPEMDAGNDLGTLEPDMSPDLPQEKTDFGKDTSERKDAGNDRGDGDAFAEADEKDPMKDVESGEGCGCHSSDSDPHSFWFLLFGFWFIRKRV